MNCGSWNAGELRQLADRRKWLLFEGIKNAVIDNGIRRFFGGVAENQEESPGAPILAPIMQCVGTILLSLKS
jgi:putative AlgH/UPF0301 family transcriptional regulator